MSHFGKAGPPDIRDTYSLLVLNISFRTTADDLFPLFDKYGKVVDVFIPRDRRYADEAQKAVERLDGRTVDGREIMVQFAKYGPNAERIEKGRIIESVPNERSRSRSPPLRHREVYRERGYRERSRSRSVDRYSRDSYHGRERVTRHRSRSGSPYRSRDRRRDRYEDERGGGSRSYESASLVRHSPSPRRSLSPLKASPKDNVPDGRKHSLTPRSQSPSGHRVASRSPSPNHSDAED